MFPSHTYLNPGTHPYPHIGQFIRAKLRELHVSSPEAARRLGVSTSAVHAYYKQPSLQFGIIWKLSMALNYDLLSDLIARYPENFPVKPNPRLAELEREVEILRGLLRRKGFGWFYSRQFLWPKVRRLCAAGFRAKGLMY